MNKLKWFHPFLLLAAAALPGQVPAPRSVPATATQAVIHYEAANPTPCQVQVSPNRSMSPLVPDVDPSLFAGANLDSRPGSISSPSGADRYFVVGKRRADVASDGNRYSRALQAFTEYYYLVTCGGTTQSGQFMTADPLLGNNFPEPPPFDPLAFGNYAWPTINWNDQTRTYVDPMTGILLKRATAPGWYGQTQTAKTFGFALDLNSAWTNASNILSGKAGTLAGYSGAGGDPLFVALDPGQLTGYSGSNFGGWAPTQTLDNLMVRVFGVGNATISGCLSDDSGAHCVSPTIDFVTLNSSGGNPAGTYPASCANDTSTGCFPNNGLWGGWNFTPVNGQMAASAGTLNVAGSTVTPVSPPTFNLNWKPGGKIYIAGSAPGCSNSLCTIASVNTSSSLTIQENAGTLSGAAFKTANSGILLWVKKGSGTSNATISVNFDYAYSDQFASAEGQTPQCSSNSVTVSFAADGVTPITPVAGELCLAAHQDGTTQVIYLLIPSTGEIRMLSPLWFINSSDASIDQPFDPVAGTIHGFAGAFDASDPNTIYVQVGTTGGVTLFKGVYNAATYNYKAYTHSLYPNATAGYNPGQDTTKPWYRGPGWSDTGITWTNLTKGSLGMDLGSQIAASDKNWSSTLFQPPVVTQISNGRAFALNYPMGGPESLGLIHSFDLATGRLVQSADTWSTFPDRWCAIHSNVAINGWYGLICNPLAGGAGFASNAGLMGNGPWQITPSAMAKNGSFSADTSMTLSAPLDPCPPIPAFLQSLTPANPGCVTFQSHMACSLTPYPGENTKWPCEYNPNYSEVQPLAAGDGILVTNGTGSPETLLIASVTSLGNAMYQFTAIRASTPNVGLRSTSTGWTGYAIPPSAACGLPSCTPGVGLWFDGTAASVTWRLDPGAFAAHADLGNGPTPGSSSYCQSGQCRFNRPMSQQIGSFASANTFQFGSFAGMSGAMALQGYPSVHQLMAPPTEKVWMLDFHHLNPSYGSGAEVVSDVGAVSYNLVSGTKGVFRFTSVNGGLNYKSVPVIAYAGYHLLQDISSPAKGNVITDSTPWQYCVVLNAGECQTGSAAGQVYMSVPQTVVRGDQNCVSNWYEDNFPCVFTPSAQAGFAIQRDISRSDPAGVYWRRMTMGLSGPGRQFQFGSFIPDPTGAWAFIQGYWLDGVRNDLLIARLPTWPNPQDVTTDRSNFVMRPVTAGPNTNLPNARVRFGYAENGPPAGFFCTPRQDACATGGTPYAFLSENPNWQSCAGGCTVQVPAIPGRVLYYAIDRQDNSGNLVPGEVQVQLVP